MDPSYWHFRPWEVIVPYSIQIDDRFMVLIHPLGEKLCQCPLQTVMYGNCQHKAILMVARHAK